MFSFYLPIIASKTYRKFKHDPNFFKITKLVLKKMKKLSSEIRRARFAQKEVQKHIDKTLENPATKLLQCRKGCSACCHSQVSITSDEAHLYADKITKGHKVDLALLRLQAEARNSSLEWYRIPHSLRGCIFLDENNACSIYEDRPMVCRTNYVFSDPKLCSTEDGQEKSVSLLNTPEADMAIVGAFEASNENGALPYMLWKALEKFSFRGPFKEISTMADSKSSE